MWGTGSVICGGLALLYVRGMALLYVGGWLFYSWGAGDWLCYTWGAGSVIRGGLALLYVGGWLCYTGGLALLYVRAGSIIIIMCEAGSVILGALLYVRAGSIICGGLALLYVRAGSIICGGWLAGPSLALSFAGQSFYWFVT